MGTLTPIEKTKKIVILFDGVCNLCNGAVQFIIERDSEKRFAFASLQSEFGKTQLLKAGLNPQSLQSILVIEDNRILQRSDAALYISKHLDGFWSSLYVFRFVPKIIRDGVYNFIARYRYTVFGKQDQCMLPSKELNSRFIQS